VLLLLHAPLQSPHRIGQHHHQLSMAEITNASKKGDRNTNFHSANLLNSNFGARKMANQIAHCWYLKIACLSTSFWS